jgi:hypothetical protein
VEHSEVTDRQLEALLARLDRIVEERIRHLATVATGLQRDR